MRIETCPTNQITRLQPATRTTAATQAQSQASASLSLSPTGSLMMSAQQALRELPPVREAQVKEISSLLTAGRYDINPQAIATAMIGGVAEGATAGE